MPTVVSGVTSGGGSGSSGEPLLAAHILTYHAPLATINAMTSATTGASNQATSALTVAGNTSTNLQTHTATYHVANSVITALQASDTTTAAAIAAIDTSIGVLDGAIAGVTSVIGLPDGLAQLDTNGVIPRNQLPTVMSYKGSLILSQTCRYCKIHHPHTTVCRSELSVMFTCAQVPEHAILAALEMHR